MKKTTIYLTLLAGALGVLAISPKLTAATDSASAMPACNLPGCCGGMTAPMSDDAKAKPDLLTTCPVSGEKLGEMGDAYVFTYKGQEVKLCCKSCKKKFDKDPEKYLAIIRAADKK